MFKRLFISFTSIIVISFTFVIFVTIKLNSEVVNDEIKNTLNTLMDNNVFLVEQIIENATDELLMLSINTQIQDNLKYFHSISSNSNEQIISSELYSIGKTNIQRSGYVASFYPFSSDEHVFSQNEDFMYTVDKSLYSEKWFINTMNKNGKINSEFISEDNNWYVRFSTIVYDTDDWTSQLGIISVDVVLDNIATPLKMSPLGKTGIVFLLDKDYNQMLPFTDSEKLTDEAIQNLKQGPAIINNKYYGILRNVYLTEWKLVGYTSVDEMNEKYLNTQRNVIAIGIVAIILAIISELYFSYITSKPIKTLATIMNKKDFVSKTNVPPHLTSNVKLLYENYNLMIDKFDDLIEQVYISTTKEKEMKLKLLQSQINPHFLYNTLDTVGWLALKYNAPDINKITNSLGTMLRNSLNSGQDFLTIEQELQQVQSYIEIQKIRYDNSFSTSYCVEENLRDQKIIKLILQPLVENALIHAFETYEGYKSIEISCFSQNRDIILNVKNTGNPINIDKVIKILNGEAINDGSYGIRNINERLKEAYGNNYGLSYKKIEDNTYVTCASMIIPKSMEN